VPAAQHLLFPDPRPLVERLGREFFLQLPAQPGVYLMRGAADEVLYVGKARNLRKRLTAYRVANPDRLRRRHLRLLGRVLRVEIQLCADEADALRREAELIYSLKPKFNRAGTWAPPPHYLVWYVDNGRVTLSLTDRKQEDRENHGPLRGTGRWVKAALVRVLWCALNPSAGLSEMPAGWCHMRLPEPAVMVCTGLDAEVRSALTDLTCGRFDGFSAWVQHRRAVNCNPRSFDQQVFEGDLEILQRSRAKPFSSSGSPQLEFERLSNSEAYSFGQVGE
jgi:predicted GIY-YIG superfamily endonuclease